jgi:3-hexulose-6-phosphate synthase
MSLKEKKDKSDKLSPKSLINRFKSKKETKETIEQEFNSEKVLLPYKTDSNNEYSSFEDFFLRVKKACADTNLEENVDLISTPQLSDALQRLTGFNGVIPLLKPVNGQKVFGKVLTASTNELDWGTSVQAIDSASKGQVIFIVVEGNDNAVWGELTSKTAQMKGISGTIIHGACRDLEALKKMNYPVFSTNIVPNAGKPLLEGQINIKVNLEEIVVNPGDYIFGDECGVVLIPQEIFEDVINVLWEIKNSEKEIISQISNGRSLLEILGLD